MGVYAGDARAGRDAVWPFWRPALAVDGRQLRGVELWRVAWRAVGRRLQWEPAIACECESGPCDHAPDETIALGAQVPAGLWSSCPRALARHPILTTAAEVDSLARLSPLSHWPDGWAAGVVECLQALAAEREWQADQAARKA